MIQPMIFPVPSKNLIVPNQYFFNLHFDRHVCPLTQSLAQSAQIQNTELMENAFIITIYQDKQRTKL